MIGEDAWTVIHRGPFRTNSHLAQPGRGAVRSEVM